MRTIWLIGLQSLQHLMKDRTAVIWMLIVPCLYIFVFGSAFRGGSDPSRSTADLAVDNQDEGYLAERLIAGLKSENLRIDILTKIPEKHPIRMLSIPDSFTTNLLKGKKVHLLLTKRPDSNLEAGMTAVMGIRKAYYRLLADLAEIAVAGQKKEPASFTQLDQREPLIGVQTSYAGKHVIIPSGFHHTVPANIIQFSLIMLFIYGGATILEEKQNGLLRRIRIGPVDFLQLFLGKLLNVLWIGFVQIALLMIVGRFVFGVYYGSSPVSLVLLVIVYCLAIGSMGLCMGFVIKGHDKLIGVSIVVGLSMAALSGCWWPLEVSPPWMQKFAMVLPSGLALKALHQLISFGKGFEAVWPFILVLGGFAVLFSFLFARILARNQAQ
jgi:ABC-2 type transport system permease protein